MENASRRGQTGLKSQTTVRTKGVFVPLLRCYRFDKLCTPPVLWDERKAIVIMSILDLLQWIMGGSETRHWWLRGSELLWCVRALVFMQVWRSILKSRNHHLRLLLRAWTWVELAVCSGSTHLEVARLLSNSIKSEAICILMLVHTVTTITRNRWNFNVSVC